MNDPESTCNVTEERDKAWVSCLKQGQPSEADYNADLRNSGLSPQNAWVGKDFNPPALRWILSDDLAHNKVTLLKGIALYDFLSSRPATSS